MDNTGSFGAATGGVSPALSRAMQGGNPSASMQPPMLSQVTNSAPTAPPQTGSSMPPMPGQQPMQGMGGTASPIPTGLNPQDITYIIQALGGRLKADTDIQKSLTKR